MRGVELAAWFLRHMIDRIRGVGDFSWSWSHVAPSPNSVNSVNSVSKTNSDYPPLLILRRGFSIISNIPTIGQLIFDMAGGAEGR